MEAMTSFKYSFFLLFVARDLYDFFADGDVIGQVKASDADEPNTIFKYTIGGKHNLLLPTLNTFNPC